MTRSRLPLAALLLSGAMSAGCVASQAGEQTTTAAKDRLEIREGAMRPSPDRVPETLPPVTGEAPSELVARVRDDVIRRSGVDPGTLKLVRDEAVTWRDGSLGCPRPGEVYPQMPVPGYWIVFSTAGRDYDYRIDETGGFRLCDGMRTLPPATGGSQD